jgi:hypothetical protein
VKRLFKRWGRIIFLVPAVVAGLLILIGGKGVPFIGQGQTRLAGAATCTTCLGVTGPSTSPVLYPGADPSHMPVTFKNLTDTSLNVTSLDVTVAFSGTPPAACSASGFRVGGTDISGQSPTLSTTGTTTTINLPAPQAIAAGQSWTYDTTLALPDTGQNQDGCRGQGLSLSYTGHAIYTLLTTTALNLSQNASGDSATLTATVSPTDTTPAAAGHTPSTGDGSVKFYTCTDASNPTSCTTLVGTATSFSSPGVASISIPAGTVGSYNLEAVFVPADPTNFVTSSSPVVTQSLTGCVSAQTSGASKIIANGTTYSGNYEVTSGSSLWLNGGTITGNVTVDPGGQFAASGGTVGGNVQSTGGPIAISGTTVNGNVQSQPGGLSLGPTTFVKGNVLASGGGPFCAQGTSPTQGQVQIRGNLQVQSLTSSTTSSVCSTNVGNNVLWQQNASPGLIGSCGGNTILGNLQVQNNSGNVTIGASGGGNTTTGNIIVNGNTGGGTLTGNRSGGNCLLSGDKPGVVGSSNTAAKSQNQCNTGSAGA